MKYAIISDIHGNMPALRLVLDDAKAQGAEGFILGGDYTIRAPWFNEAICTLRSLPNSYAVRGNEEVYLHMQPGEDAQFAICYWVNRVIEPENLAWLDNLPERLDLVLNGAPVHIAHQPDVFLGREIGKRLASRHLPARYPATPISRERFQGDVRRTLTGSPSFQRVLNGLTRGVYIFGHTHTQWSAQFSDKLFINPGSCGQPVDCMEFAACYAILNIENGRCSVDLRRIPYDPEPLIEEIMSSDQYKYAPIWSSLIFLDWRTCSEHISSFLSYLSRYAESIGDSRRPYMRDTFQAAYDAWMKEGCPVRTE
ncbi:MAG: metallophosphoesterase family protein [Clostridia bacterium]|nr:metallophosphoesterase family protein [Clostridia bacterium]